MGPNAQSNHLVMIMFTVTMSIISAKFLMLGHVLTLTNTRSIYGVSIPTNFLGTTIMEIRTHNILLNNTSHETHGRRTITVLIEIVRPHSSIHLTPREGTLIQRAEVDPFFASSRSILISECNVAFFVLRYDSSKLLWGAYVCSTGRTRLD